MSVSVRKDRSARAPEPPEEPEHELSPELRTLREDLAAFQQEEMLALQSCLSVLLHKGPPEEAHTAHALHLAARQRTRQCLVRLQAWR